MSLFAYGLSRSHGLEAASSTSRPTPIYLPGQKESGLGREEHDAVTAADTDHADPHAKKTKNPRGKYTKYSDQQRATIGKYASQNGIEKARKHFLVQFPNLNESTV